MSLKPAAAQASPEAEHGTVLRTPAKFAQYMRGPLNVCWGWHTPGIPTAQTLSISEYPSDLVDVVAKWDQWPFPVDSLCSISLAARVGAMRTDADLREKVLPSLLEKLQDGGHLYVSGSRQEHSGLELQQRWMSALDALRLDGIYLTPSISGLTDTWQLEARKPSHC